MRSSQLSRISILVAAILIAGCASAPRPAPELAPDDAVSNQETHLILISLDGFRTDFLDRGATPTLSRLADEGVRAEKLIPSFPTKTFPNHYTIVTGLRPSEHGLVANNIYDPVRGLRFGLSKREAVADGGWYGGEPIWVTAERQGLRTAPMFWPGSEASIGGIRPTHWVPFDDAMAPEARVDRVLGWLDLPAPDRPRFLTLYFETVDDAAHGHGPDPSEGLAKALAIVDSAVARLVEGLGERGLRVDLLIVSDHGMAATSRERVIYLDDYVEPETANVIDWSPVLGLWPPATEIESVYEALAGAHPNLAVYRREEIPERYQFLGHQRIPPIVGIADDGWSVTSRSFFARCPECFDGGAHGYAQWSASMAALLIGHGPSFRLRTRIGPMENFHLYNAMCAILGLEPAANSGDPRRATELLAQSDELGPG